MVLVVVGAPLVAGGGGRGDDRTAGRGPQQRRHAVARVRGMKEAAGEARAVIAHACAPERVYCHRRGKRRTRSVSRCRSRSASNRKKINVCFLGPICR
jgi:hypothetical protein